jgi:hypothetical protein
VAIFFAQRPIGIAMKKTFAAVLAAFTLTAAPAFAQTAPVATAAASAEVRQLLESMRFREVMAASLKLSDADKQAALASAEKAIPATIAAVHNVQADPTLMDEMIAEMAPRMSPNHRL